MFDYNSSLNTIIALIEGIKRGYICQETVKCLLIMAQQIVEII